MIPADEALALVLSKVITPITENIDIDEAVGRILKEDIVADRDFPPFNRVMMDGIAINSRAWESGRREFYIEGIQTAGSPQKTLSEEINCLEVMTGAMLPLNTDIVIRYEDVQTDGNVARVTIDEVSALQNIHLKGTDRHVDEKLIDAHCTLSPAEIAVLATVGKERLRVFEHLKIAIVSTGDELVDVTATPNPYQIRRSNSHALKAALKKIGHESTTYHVNDEKSEMLSQLRSILEENDMVILSGGVSKGKKDFVPEILEQLQVEKLFHGVKQRPGKPFWFGYRESASPTAVFALPGNPVSTFMCYYSYVQPWLNKCYGKEHAIVKATLTTDFEFSPQMTYFLQVKLSTNGSEVLATPISGKGSGDLANLLEADAFMELPYDKQHFSAGESYPIVSYR